MAHMCCNGNVHVSFLGQDSTTGCRDFYSQEEIGKVCCRDSQVRPGTLCPLLGQDLTVDAGDLHVLETTCDRVEPGREGDDVEFMVGPVFLDYAIGDKSLDRIVSNIDHIDIGLAGSQYDLALRPTTLLPC